MTWFEAFMIAMALFGIVAVLESLALARMSKDADYLAPGPPAPKIYSTDNGYAMDQTSYILFARDGSSLVVPRKVRG